MIGNFVDSFMNVIGRFLPEVFGAIIILVIGLIVVELITKGVGKLLKFIKLDERIQGDRDEPPVAMEGILTQVTRYLLLLYLFILVLEILGVVGVLDPVKGMFSKFLAALPNIIAGLLIAVIGYIVARMLAGAVTMLLSGLDKVNASIGLSEEFKLARFIGQLVFIFTFVPILIAALDAVKLEAISVPATAMLGSLMLAVPGIVGAAIILAVAFFVGRFVANVIADLLKNLGLDGVPEKLGIAGAFSEERTASKTVGWIVLFFIMLAASISAVEILGMGRLSDLLRQLTEFAGDVALGLVILVVGSLIAKVAYQALSEGGTNPTLSGVARYAIIGLVVAIGLRAMGVADDIVSLAFGLTLAGIAVAFALAFGLGGREAAGKELEAWFAKMRGK
jgi:hypothetical protein